MQELKKLIKTMEKLEHEYRVKICDSSTTIWRERYGHLAEGVAECRRLAQEQLKEAEAAQAEAETTLVG
jgi:hypothetical protein